ncbi:ABC transporter permease [Rothia sp. AR01]|uniref:ABC transporter permease n=1 Tax=Rothia santali TaxID=2949643 RepID=A0A9X2KH62_9MICC|nr:ABC transporter permease [Rothia santali]MCP3424510.1 ABC transporter permease [Rothia santali]
MSAVAPLADPAAPEDGPAPGGRRVLAQGLYETLAMLRNGEQLMLLILFPLMALLGLAFTSFIDPWARDLGMSRVDVAMPGVLALCALSTALSGQGIATGFDRRYGVLRFLSTTPLGRGGLILGKAMAVLSVVVVQYVVMGLVGAVLGWTPGVAGVLLSIPPLLLGVAAFTALGLLVAGTIRAEATLAVVNTLWLVLASLGGSLIPAHRLPGVGPWLVEALPSGALGAALRSGILDHQLSLPHCLVLAAWAVVLGALARRFFKWA